MNKSFKSTFYPLVKKAIQKYIFLDLPGGWIPKQYPNIFQSRSFWS